MAPLGDRVEESIAIPQGLTAAFVATGKKFRTGRGRWLVLPLLVMAFVGATPFEFRRDVDWPSHNGSMDEGSYSQLAQINTRTVSRLGLAWSLDLPGEVSLEATPLAVGGKLYFTGSYADIYAVDVVSGRLVWKHEVEVWKHNPAKMRLLFPVNRGAAYSDGRVYSATLDGRLLALDAATGRLLWSVQTVDPVSLHVISGAPRAFGDLVVIGNGGADFGMRGYVTAYDARTGQQRWRFYTVPGDPAKDGDDPALKLAAGTWGQDHWKISGGGGTVWDSMTYDPELDRLYIGVGNSGPYNPSLRDPGGGDNLFLASIVALDARTGKYVWHYQVNPREAWDYKATANMVATTLTIEGKPRRVLMQSPTNGFFYVLDRDTGKLISAEKIGKVTWASRIDLVTGRPVEAPNIRFEAGQFTMWPSPLGAHNWQAMAYSPASGLVYIPYMQLGAKYSLDGESRLGGVSIQTIKGDPEDGKGALLAWDPVAQRVRWKVQHDALWNGGALATAGGLVFQGDGDGRFSAYDAASGNRLWQFNAGLGIIAAPIGYRVKGVDYVSLLVGYGGAVDNAVASRGWKFGAQPRRLLTFALGGRHRLPASAPQDYGVRALDDPTLRLDAARVKVGAGLYGGCGFCHGAGLKSNGAAPDLRESQVALDLNAFKAVVRDGALMQVGMPRYEMLSDDDVTNLYMYIRSGARTALGKPNGSADTQKSSRF